MCRKNIAMFKITAVVPLKVPPLNYEHMARSRANKYKIIIFDIFCFLSNFCLAKEEPLESCLLILKRTYGYFAKVQLILKTLVKAYLD